MIAFNEIVNPPDEGFRPYGDKDNRKWGTPTSIPGADIVSYLGKKINWKGLYEPFKDKVADLNKRISANNAKIVKYSDDQAVKAFNEQSIDADNFKSLREWRFTFSEIRHRISVDSMAAFNEFNEIIVAVAKQAKEAIDRMNIDKDIETDWNPLINRWGLPHYLHQRIFKTLRISFERYSINATDPAFVKGQIGITFTEARNPQVLTEEQAQLDAIKSNPQIQHILNR